MWKVREIADKVTNVVMNYTEVEAKVREATNDEAWGPTGALMQEIAQATFTFEHFPEVMTMLWRRMLQDNKRNWRRTYKSLLLLNYLVRNGSERIVTSSREHIYDLRGLENYSFIDEFGKDQGINIRHKVKELIDFIQDDEKLREERKKAKKNKDKFIGMSCDEMGGITGGPGERWEETPRWNYDENQWDDKGKGTTLGFHESPNDSDENEKYDSEGEPDVNRSPTGNNPKSVTFPNLKKSPAASPVNGTPTKSKPPIKKIDLGAAATYGKTVKNEKISTPVSLSNDLLGDVSTLSSIPAQNTTRTQSGTIDNLLNEDSDVSNDFGDFTAVFPTQNNVSNNSVSKADEFADFSSAFTSLSVSSKNAGNITVENKSNTDLLSDVNLISSSSSNSLIDANLTINSAKGFSHTNYFSSPSVTLMQPSSLPSFAQSDHHDKISAVDKQSSLQNVGSTWSNLVDLNINVDNLIPSRKSSTSSAPSMNQMAAEKPIGNLPIMSANRYPVPLNRPMFNTEFK